MFGRGKIGSAVRDARAAAETAEHAAERADEILADLQEGKRGIVLEVLHLKATVHLTPRKP